MFSFICVWINDWVNNREAGDLRRHRGHYDVDVMQHITHERPDVWNQQLDVFVPQHVQTNNIENISRWIPITKGHFQKCRLSYQRNV